MIINGRLFAYGLPVAAAISVAAQAHASDVLDAHYTTTQSVYGFSLNEFTPLAQTFTVENSGTLDSVIITAESVNGPNQAFGGGVTLSITKLMGDTPSFSPSDVLGSAYIPTASFTVEPINSPMTFNFSGVSVSAGEKLAIVATTNASGYFGWNGDLGGCCGPDGTYSGGAAYYSFPTSFTGDNPVYSTWTPVFDGSADFAFKTFVSPHVVAAVPEPATWAMMIGGIGMAGGIMRRQRRVTAKVSFA